MQEAECEKYFSDTITGSKFERKGLEALLAFVRPGDTVIVWKLNRLRRSLKDLLETLTILKDRGVDFISLTEKIDTTTPGGKLIFHLMGVLAEFERDLIRERTNVCDAHRIPYTLCGKVIVATRPEDLPALTQQYERGVTNSIPDLELIGPERLRDYA